MRQIRHEETSLCSVKQGSFYLTQFCFLFFCFAIAGVIFVGVIYKCVCTYMNMCISVIYLFLFFLRYKNGCLRCLYGLVSTLSTVGFSLHLQMASFLSAATGSHECLSKTLMIKVFNNIWFDALRCSWWLTLTQYQGWMNMNEVNLVNANSWD